MWIKNASLTRQKIFAITSLCVPCIERNKTQWVVIFYDVTSIVVMRQGKPRTYAAKLLLREIWSSADIWLSRMIWTPIGIFESPKCDVNPQPNTRGIGPLVGRTSGNRRSVMHVLAVIFSITYHFFLICQYIFIQVILSDREIYPLLMYPSTFLVF